MSTHNKCSNCDKVDVGILHFFCCDICHAEIEIPIRITFETVEKESFVYEVCEDCSRDVAALLAVQAQGRPA